MTLGEKIQKLRKERGLSQEELAKKVTVTRQTISKWELNQSMPDLDFIAQLSQIFDVSSDYLIRDEMTEPDEASPMRRSPRFTEKGKRIVLSIASAAMLVAGVTCLLADFIETGTFSWSRIVIASLALGWVLLLPSLTAKTKPLLKTLVLITVLPFPYLAALSAILGIPVVFSLGSSIALVTIATLWMIYALVRHFGTRSWLAAGFSLLLAAVLQIVIVRLCAFFLPEYPREAGSDFLGLSSILIMAFICFSLELAQRRKNKASGH